MRLSIILGCILISKSIDQEIVVSNASGLITMCILFLAADINDIVFKK